MDLTLLSLSIKTFEFEFRFVMITVIMPRVSCGPGGGDMEEKDVYLVRLMEYLPGTVLADVPLTPQLSFQVGQYAAMLDLALKVISSWALDCFSILKT